MDSVNETVFFSVIGSQARHIYQQKFKLLKIYFRNFQPFVTRDKFCNLVTRVWNETFTLYFIDWQGLTSPFTFNGFIHQLINFIFTIFIQIFIYKQNYLT